MARRRLAGLAGLAAAVALIGAGLAGCSAGSPPSSSVNPGSDQSLYVASALQDRTFLFDGFVVTRRALSTGVNDAITVVVQVCGSQATNHDCRAYRSGLPADLATPSASVPPSTNATPSTTVTPSPAGSASPSPTTSTGPTPTPTTSAPTNPDLVRLGGLIKTTLTSTMPGQIVAESTEQQPVLTPTESATWEWVVTPTATGSYHLEVHLSVLQGATGLALLPDQTVDISLDVQRTSESTVSSVWNGIKELAVVLGASGVTLGAIITFVARRFRRKKTPVGAAPLSGPAGPPTPPAR